MVKLFFRVRVSVRTSLFATAPLKLYASLIIIITIILLPGYKNNNNNNNNIIVN